MPAKNSIDKTRRQVPSHDPMPGVDESPIEPGADRGGQLPPKPWTGDAQHGPRQPEKAPGEERSDVNPNQGDLPKPFWPD